MELKDVIEEIEKVSNSDDLYLIVCAATKRMAEIDKPHALNASIKAAIDTLTRMTK